MPECDYINKILNMPWVLNIPNALDIPEYALTEF